MSDYEGSYPHPPAPYRSRYNLPLAFLGLPFLLLRDQLYPKFPDVVAGALEQGYGPEPAQYLPDRGGYRFHGPEAIGAVVAARQWLQELAARARGETSAPADAPATNFPVELPRALDRMYPSPPPGYDVQTVSFEPNASFLRDGVGQRVFNIAAQCPWVESPAGGTVRVRSPAEISEQLSRAVPDLLEPR